jgi:lysophospholipase L1-like esterase
MRMKTMAALALLWAAAAAGAQGQEQMSGQMRQCATNVEPRSVEFPWMSIERWNAINKDKTALAAKGNVDVLFLGDSITEGWPKSEWDSHFGQYKAANFGIGGDHTGNVLWRLQNGGMDKLRPKVVVLLIGTNNFGLCGEGPEQVYNGIASVVSSLRQLYPDAKILLNAVLPVEPNPDHPRRLNVAKVNRDVAKLDDGRHVFFRDYGPRFVQADGTISPRIMPDYLHLTEQGYKIWGDAMQPDIDRLLKQ